MSKVLDCQLSLKTSSFFSQFGIAGGESETLGYYMSVYAIVFNHGNAESMSSVCMCHPAKAGKMSAEDIRMQAQDCSCKVKTSTCHTRIAWDNEDTFLKSRILIDSFSGAGVLDVTKV